MARYLLSSGGDNAVPRDVTAFIGRLDKKKNENRDQQCGLLDDILRENNTTSTVGDCWKTLGISSSNHRTTSSCKVKADMPSACSFFSSAIMSQGRLSLFMPRVKSRAHVNSDNNPLRWSSCKLLVTECTVCSLIFVMMMSQKPIRP